MSTAPCANSAYVAPAPSPMIKNCRNDCTVTYLSVPLTTLFRVRAGHICPAGTRRMLNRSARGLGTEDRTAEDLVEADLRLLHEVPLEPVGGRLRIPRV